MLAPDNHLNAKIQLFLSGWNNLLDWIILQHTGFEKKQFTNNSNDIIFLIPSDFNYI